MMKIRMKAEIIEGNGKVLSKEVEVEVPDVTEYGNPKEFYEIFDRYEQPVIAARNQIAEEITKAYLEKAASGSKKRGHKCEIEGEIGRIEVNEGDSLVPEHQPKERILSRAFQRIALTMCTELSFRKSVEIMNGIFHRGAGKQIIVSTYTEYCHRAGKAVAERKNRRTSEILKEHKFDPENGKPVSEKEIAEEIRKDAENYQNQSAMKKAAARINQNCKAADERIHSEKVRLEYPDTAIYISVDEIGVKHQKEERRPEAEKKGVYAWNTVIAVQSPEQTYTLTGTEMKQVFRSTTAYLLDKHLMENKHLIFFTDGARNIRCNIEELFRFRSYTIILDWYHLEKRCKEYLSMSVRGGKEKRNEILEKLLHILWAGNVDEAMTYLKNLSSEKLRTPNRIDDLCAYFEKNRVCIPCYALRHYFGLKISSNRVEKANDLIVAHRQKHQGMSWSVSGSGSLAQIQVLFMNQEFDSWFFSNPA